MNSRPVVLVSCRECGGKHFVRRLRGPWRGVVQVCDDYGFNAPLVRLAGAPNAGYSLATFVCPKCRPPLPESAAAAIGRGGY